MDESLHELKMNLIIMHLHHTLRKKDVQLQEHCGLPMLFLSCLWLFYVGSFARVVKWMQFSRFPLSSFRLDRRG